MTYAGSPYQVLSEYIAETGEALVIKGREDIGSLGIESARNL